MLKNVERRVDVGSMWGRCGIDEGSMWGRCGVDVGSIGGRCICGWKIYTINEEVEVGGGRGK